MFVTRGRVREPLGRTGVRLGGAIDSRTEQTGGVIFPGSAIWRKYWQDWGKVIRTRDLPNLRTDAALGKKMV